MIDIPRKSWTYLEFVRRRAEQYGDRIFCTFADGDTLTFTEFETATNALASALADLDINRGDRVVGMMYNSKAFLLTMVAVHKRGAIFVPINTELKGAFLEHQIQNIEPCAAFVSDEFRPAFETISIANLNIEATVSIEGDGKPLPGSRAIAFADLLETQARPEDIVKAEAHDICMIMFTSGTTGPSKGTLMPHAHSILFGFGAGRALKMTPEDCMFICMPFFHAMGLMLQLTSCLVYGSSAHVIRRFSATTWLDEIRASKATLTYGLGVIPEFIFRQTPSPHDKDHNLRIMVAVPIGEDWGAPFEERFGLRLMQAYGMTECNIPAYGKLEDAVIAGCAGHIDDDFFEVRIVDTDTDEELPKGEVGEIIVRPTQPACFMQGYFRMPERTIEAWRNLWFHTGDAGRLDAEGRLFFIDRIKDCIRRRGENISAFEVEQVINNHPEVAESCVIGVRNADVGGEEEVKACVVFVGKDLEPASILDWCVERMPRFAVPRYIEYVAALDKTPTGKLQKQGLRDAGITSDTWDRENVGYVVPR
jgi:crotonobetaine/carnitine-CoA ligase